MLIVILSGIFILTSCESLSTTSNRFSSEEIILRLNETKPIDIFLLIDQSGSMSGIPGVPATDPTGLRAEAAKYFVNNLSTKSDKKNPNRIGVINFGTSASLSSTIPLTPVYYEDQKNINFITTNIRPLNLGETNFISALKLAYSQFSASGTFSNNRNSAIVIFTDGEPSDSRNLSLEEYFSEINGFVKKSFSNSGTKFFMVGIDKQGKTWSKTLSYWKNIVPENQIFKITQMQDLKKVFNNIIRQLFQIPSVPPDIVGEAKKTFTVPPYLDSLELHAFFESRNANLEIHNPDNKIIQFNENGGNVRIDKGSYSLFIIPNPEPGYWNYKLTDGKGKVLIYKNFIPGSIGVISPADSYPVGKSSRVIVKFSRKDGSEIISNPKYPLRFVVSIKDKDGNKIFSDILKKQFGETYQTAKLFTPLKNGVYSLHFEVAGGTEYSYSQTKDINVKIIPYVDFIKPKEGSTIPVSNSIHLSVRLEENGKALDPKNGFETDPLLLLRAQIKDSPYIRQSRTKIEPEVIWLDSEKNDPSIFTCLLPVEEPQEGSYTVLVALKGLNKKLGDYSDISVLDITMKKNLVQKIIFVLQYFLIGLFLVWILQWLIFILWRRKKKCPQSQIGVYIKEKKEDSVPLKRLVIQASLSGKRYRLLKLKRKSFKNINGYLFVFGSYNSVYYAYFDSKLKYILFPSIAIFGKRILSRGYEKRILENLYILLQ